MKEIGQRYKSGNSFFKSNKGVALFYWHILKRSVDVRTKKSLCVIVGVIFCFTALAIRVGADEGSKNVKNRLRMISSICHPKLPPPILNTAGGLQLPLSSL